MTTYTREQIMQMDTEQLRVAIAEAKGIDIQYPFSGKYGPFYQDGLTGMGTPYLSKLPNWPTSIADAWELFEEMRRLIGHVSLNSSVNNDTDKWYLLSNPKIPCFGYDHVVEDTAPRVISLAWLAWDAARKEDK